MVKPPARFAKLSLTERETAKPKMLTNANRDDALMPSDSATIISVINHRMIFIMERIKVCRLFSICLKRSSARSKIFSTMAFTIRQTTRRMRAKKMVFKAPSQPFFIKVWTPASTLLSNCPVSMFVSIGCDDPFLNKVRGFCGKKEGQSLGFALLREVKN